MICGAFGLDKSRRTHAFRQGLPGEQPAILDRDLFNAVQVKLNDQRHRHTVARGTSEALLIGRIYDDRGNRMSPSHVRKGGIKYRYYLSSALLHGQPGRAGSVRRVPGRNGGRRANRFALRNSNHAGSRLVDDGGSDWHLRH